MDYLNIKIMLLLGIVLLLLIYYSEIFEMAVYILKQTLYLLLIVLAVGYMTCKFLLGLIGK
ncbi:hypothetical protein [Floricoccus penangensis]|uniref:hypothetical protein n=1 Tax=Floricoccus penangensis TaxID=1859475 RepID=UPI00203ED68B|nr:hypothetical protein [Floricoccus penangensis]URZ87061.1 hypothetical protein KIW23_08230 [Floricoccus penangensis]